MKQILQIKISLDGIKPEIWRRFLVENSISLEQLHNIIQEVMGWENYHLYEFRIDDATITPEEEGYNLAESSFHKLSKSPEFVKMLEEQDRNKGQATLDVNKVNKILRKMESSKPKNSFDVSTPISKLVNTEKQKFNYVYDFGDCWEHILVVEKIMEEEKSCSYPVCLGGERTCPPEDCGSVPGYYELMEIRKDKSHPEYKERVLEWLGEDYDPEHFDINQINKRLKKYGFKKAVKTNNEKLFQDFEDMIGKKYSHMAESMLILSEDFPQFFFENDIEVKSFAKKDIKKLFDEYLDFMSLSEAECSMLFQMLIDFCEFCKTKGIDVGFLKEHLIKNKEDIFEYWTYDEEEPLEGNPFNNIAPKEFIENFDIYYNMMNFEKRKKKLEEIDKEKIIDFLERTHKLMEVTFEESKEIRKKNPNLSDTEYLRRIDEIVNKKYGKELFNYQPNPDDLMKVVFSLPKEQAKKFFELTFKLGEASKFKFGSIKRKETIEELLNDLQELIDNVKK